MLECTHIFVLCCLSGKGKNHFARVRVKDVPDQRKKGWETRFGELVEYKKLHGNCDVKKNDPAYKKLGGWVANQREIYREYFRSQQLQPGGGPAVSGGTDKKKIAMLQRFQRLTEVGFNFVLRHRKRA